MGSVSITPLPDVNNAAGSVRTGLAVAWANASSAFNMASNALAALKSFVPTITANTNVSIGNISSPNLPGIPGKPDKPGNLTPLFPAVPQSPIFKPIDYIEIPAFPDLTLEELAIPDVVINTNFEKYSSDLLTSLKTKMSDRIINGGTGLSPAVETAIFNRDQERALLSLDEAKTRVADDWAKRGFSLPNGLLMEAISNLEVEFTNKRLEVSRDIAFKQADLEQTNVNTTIQQAVNLESALMTDQRQFSELMLRASEALQKAKVDIYSVWTAFYKTYVESIKNYSEAMSDKARTEVEMNKDLLGRYGAELDGFKTQVQAEVERVNVLLKQYGEDITAFSAQVSSWQAIGNVRVEELRARITESLGNANIGVEVARANIQTAIEGAKVQVQALIAAGHTAAQLAAGAMAGSHVSASVSAGNSVGSSLSGNISESHNYQNK